MAIRYLNHVIYTTILLYCHLIHGVHTRLKYGDLIHSLSLKKEAIVI